jgi:hypothetical protein
VDKGSSDAALDVLTSSKGSPMVICMAMEQKREEILKAADELRQAKAAYDAAVARFDAVLDGRVPAVKQAKQKRIGKAPDPNSLSQRVLTVLDANNGPVKIDALAERFNKSNKEIRNAIVYHQKKGVVIRVGDGLYDLIARKNGSGPHAAEQIDLNS